MGHAGDEGKNDGEEGSRPRRGWFFDGRLVNGESLGMTWWDWRKGIGKVNLARESGMRHCGTAWFLNHEGCR